MFRHRPESDAPAHLEKLPDNIGVVEPAFPRCEGQDTSRQAASPEGPGPTSEQEGLASPPEEGRAHVLVLKLNSREDGGRLQPSCGSVGTPGRPWRKDVNNKGLIGSVSYFLKRLMKEPSGNAFLIHIISLPQLPMKFHTSLPSR